MVQATALVSEMSLDERLEDLERIAQLENPALRNLLITQRHHDLCHELAAVMGIGAYELVDLCYLGL